MSNNTIKPFTSDTVGSGTVKLTLNPNNERFLDPSILFGLDLSFLKGKEVILEGKAPLWLYVNMAIRAKNSDANKIVVCQPDFGGTTVFDNGKPVLLQSDLHTGNSQDCFSVEQKGGNNFHIKFNPSPNRKWSMQDLCNNRALIPNSPNKYAVIFIDGNAANWMYAAIALVADCNGFGNIFYDSPRENALISVGKNNPGSLSARQEEVADGVVIGVVGDPNSGKSVLSTWLERYFRNAWQKSWRIDADAASPTPNWFLNMLQFGKDAKSEHDKIRNNIKKPWTRELEESIAQVIHSARKNLEVTLVDCPGGRHKSGEAPQRIPEGREILFAEIDLIIILYKDQDALEGWRKSLGAHNFSNKIFAEICSKNQKNAPTLEVHRDKNMIWGSAEGLDRDNPLPSNAKVQGIEEIVRHIHAWRLAQHAKAALSKAFLTGTGGTRYGAAVLSANGKIYSAGQYSSYNHSTNVHAEQGALLQAAMDGSFQIKMLALASTDGVSIPRPCGVCRQVMLEHAQRTGTLFDVAMVNGEGRIEIENLSTLLPFSWQSHKIKKNNIEDIREGTPSFTNPQKYDIGATVLFNSGTAIGIVWDNCLLPDKMLVKLKYVKIDDAKWKKLPHSLTESFDYERELRALGLCLPSGFGPSLCLVSKQNITEVAMGSIDTKRIPLKFLNLLERAGISQSRLSYTASRAVGLSTDDSDFDFVLQASEDEIRKFRDEARIALSKGLASIPQTSGTWRFFEKAFSGSANAIIMSSRFAESLEFDGKKVSLIFIPPEEYPRTVAFSNGEWEPLGWHSLTGEVIDDTHSPYKRSEYTILTPFREEIKVISYCKLSNLVRNGDILSVSGWLLKNRKDKQQKRLIQITQGSEPLVWLKKAEVTQ